MPGRRRGRRSAPPPRGGWRAEGAPTRVFARGGDGSEMVWTYIFSGP
jgi:hypothetical protein